MNDVIIPGWKGWNFRGGRITNEMRIWMNENIKGRWQGRAGTKKGNTKYIFIRFDNAEDAMAFKLRWI